MMTFCLSLMGVRLVAIGTWMLLNSARMGWDSIFLLLFCICLGYRRRGDDFLNFSQFVIDKILIFVILISLIDQGRLDVPIVVWIITGEFFDSGSKLLRGSMNLPTDPKLGSLRKTYTYMVVVSLLYFYPVLEPLRYQCYWIVYLPFFLSLLLALITAYFIYYCMVHFLLKGIFDSE